MVVHVGAIAQDDEHQVGNGAKHGAVARLELPERVLRALLVGDVAPDALQFEHAAAVIDDGVIGPVLPADGAIGQDHGMFVRIDPAAQSVDSGQHRGARVERDHFDESRADQLLTRPVPEAAVGVVDEGQRGIRQEPADQLALRVDDAAVAELRCCASLLPRAGA